MDAFAEFMSDFRQTMAETPQEELANLWAEVKGLQIQGPTVGDVLDQPVFFTIVPTVRPCFLEGDRTVYPDMESLKAA